MEISIQHGPGAAAARIGLQAHEVVTAEAGAMIAMSGDMNIETTTHKRGAGSVLKAVGRMLAGESFFLNHFTAGPQGGEVFLATTLAGDMMSGRLGDQTLIVQSGSFVASEQSVGMEVGWQGFRSMFSGESLFWLRIRGPGAIVLSSFGAIHQVDVDGEYIVDTGHIVAFDETLAFTLSKAGKSWMSSILGSEGIACKFRGRGRVWCQSHNPRGFGKAVGPKLKPRG